MSRKNKKTLVPKLRFPEFLDHAEWSTQKFNDLIDIIEERAGKKTHTLMSVTAGIGLISQIEKFGREIAGNAYKNYYVIQKGDFAYNKSATKQFPEGYIAMLTSHDKAALPNSIFTCFRITDENTCPKILDHLFHVNYHGAWLRKFIAIGARAHGSLNIDTKHLLDMPVVLPSFPEQQKIADCLTYLDDLITAETEKLEAYKAHKKGLMQKLFPAEGKNMPEWRFPEFRGSGKWEEERLSNVCNVLQGYGFPEILQGKSEGKYPFCKVSDISRAVAENGGLLTEAINYIGDDELTMLRANLIPKGATVFAKIGEALRLNRRAYVQKECLIDNNAVGLKAIDDKIDDYFIFLISQLIDLNRHCGGAVPSVNKTTLEAVEVLMPSPYEQKRIADCLSSLDDLIAAQAKKIEALKTHKKGLMQGLFPSADEVRE